MKKFALALMASAAMVLGMGVVANAYPAGAGSVTASPTTLAPGGVFTATATCQPAEIVTFVFEGATKTATCGAAGTAGTASLISLSTAGSASVTFNAPGTAGSYTGIATGSATGALGSFTITVAVPAAPGGSLPATGTDGTSTMTIIALGLFAVGAGLFGVSRFRSRTVTA
jgi:LPXTG-motif cell wall-anchored protein